MNILNGKWIDVEFNDPRHYGVVLENYECKMLPGSGYDMVNDGDDDLKMAFICVGAAMFLICVIEFYYIIMLKRKHRKTNSRNEVSHRTQRQSSLEKKIFI
ncbi:uncharacterized protein LOC120343312 isoform X1 [Styela clava]